MPKIKTPGSQIITLSNCEVRETKKGKPVLCAVGTNAQGDYINGQMFFPSSINVKSGKTWHQEQMETLAKIGMIGTGTEAIKTLNGCQCEWELEEEEYEGKTIIKVGSFWRALSGKAASAEVMDSLWGGYIPDDDTPQADHRESLAPKDVDYQSPMPQSNTPPFHEDSFDPEEFDEDF